MISGLAAIETKTPYSPQALADEIDVAFARFFKQVPATAWYRPSMLPETIKSLPNIAALEMKYIGHYTVRLTVRPDDQPGFFKDYQQQYGNTVVEGQRLMQPATEVGEKAIIDTSITTEADFADCPDGYLRTLALAMYALGGTEKYFYDSQTYGVQEELSAA